MNAIMINRIRKWDEIDPGPWSSCIVFCIILAATGVVMWGLSIN